MTQVLAITFPIYGAIALGYLVVVKGWFSHDDMRLFGRYVLNIALPALLFNATASRRIGEVIQPDYILVYALGGLATVLLSWMTFTPRARTPQRRALGVMGSACPNSGFVGYPIMLLTFPDLADVILAMNFLVETVLVIPICLLLLEIASSPDSRPLYRRVLPIMTGLLKMPMIIGLLLGLAVSAAGLPLPGPMAQLTSMLAASAAALSLMVIGGSLAGLPQHGNRALATHTALAKLLLHPAVMALMALALTGLGLVTLSPDLRAAVILSAAMPMFGIYTVLAQKHGLEGAASLSMLAATTGSFVTLSLLLALLG